MLHNPGWVRVGAAWGGHGGLDPRSRLPAATRRAVDAMTSGPQPAIGARDRRVESIASSSAATKAATASAALVGMGRFVVGAFFFVPLIPRSSSRCGKPASPGTPTPCEPGVVDPRLLLRRRRAHHPPEHHLDRADGLSGTPAGSPGPSARRDGHPAAVRDPAVVLVFGLIRTYSRPPLPFTYTDLGSTALLVSAYAVLTSLHVSCRGHRPSGNGRAHPDRGGTEPGGGLGPDHRGG